MKDAGWSFLPHSYSTHLFVLCRRQMALGEWQQVILSFTGSWLCCSCYARCGCIAWTNYCVLWYLVGIWWSGKCIFPPCLSIRTTRSSLLSAGKVSNTPSLSYLWALPPGLYHNLVHKNLDHPLQKRQSHACSLSTAAQPRKNGPWACNTSLPRAKEPTQPVLDLSPCMGISLLVSYCVYSFVLLKCEYQWPSGMPPSCQTPRVRWGDPSTMVPWGTRQSTALHWLPGGTC